MGLLTFVLLSGKRIVAGTGVVGALRLAIQPGTGKMNPQVLDSTAKACYNSVKWNIVPLLDVLSEELVAHYCNPTRSWIPLSPLLFFGPNDFIYIPLERTWTNLHQ